jgi:hypothetical protein
MKHIFDNSQGNSWNLHYTSSSFSFHTKYSTKRSYWDVVTGANFKKFIPSIFKKCHDQIWDCTATTATEPWEAMLVALTQVVKKVHFSYIHWGHWSMFCYRTLMGNCGKQDKFSTILLCIIYIENIHFLVSEHDKKHHI